MDFSKLYKKQDKQILKIAEDTIDRKADRVEEIINYSKKAGFKNLGLAYCTTFTKEAAGLEEELKNEGFNVVKVNCKYGRVPFDKLVPGYKGVSCNPAGQAKYLEEHSTELNIMMGLCLGHDMIFNSKSKVPVTPLIVKDRKLEHHTIERLKKT